MRTHLTNVSTRVFDEIRFGRELEITKDEAEVPGDVLNERVRPAMRLMVGPKQAR